MSTCTAMQGRNRNFFLRGQSHFSWFFPGVNSFFPVENFHFGTPKTNFHRFEKWKEEKKKKKKKKSSPHCGTFSSFHFQFSTFPFTIFSIFPPFCTFFLAAFFPIGQQKFPSQKSLGGTLPPSPHLLRHWGHSGQRTSVKCAEAKWKSQGGIVH